MSALTETPHQSYSWLRIGFTVSAILNIFLIAVIAGHIAHQRSHDLMPGAPLLARALANAEASLSPSDAAIFGSVIRENKPRYGEAILEFALTRDHLEQAIIAEQFDPDAVKKSFIDWRQSWNHLLNDFDDTLVEALSKISPEGRRRLVEQRRKALAGENSSE